jgi:hypothetical protein
MARTLGLWLQVDVVPKTGVAAMVTRYRPPDNPPAQLRLRALGSGQQFAGNKRWSHYRQNQI